MTPTRFPDLNEVLAQLTGRLRTVLGADLLGLYLTGSFALGDADEGSDVDFLAVVQHPLTGAARQAVQAMHQSLFELPIPWAQHLEGSYITAELLRRPDPQGTPIPYLDNGSRVLEESAHDNTLVVRWMTREHGVALFGPPAAEFIGPVVPDELRAEVRAVLHGWGAALLASQEPPDGGWGPQALSNAWAQPYVALSMARMLQTLQTGEIHSKRAAVAWSRAHAPEWTPLLERAWESHPRQFLNYSQPADPADLALTRVFIRSALELEPLQRPD